MLECSVEDVCMFINTEVVNAKLISWQMKLDAKRPVRKVRAPSSELKRRQGEDLKKKIKTEAYRNKIQIEHDRKNVRRPSNYKTILIDYSKLVTVRIDKHTTIYAKPGEEEKTKARFLKHYSKPIDRFNH